MLAEKITTICVGDSTNLMAIGYDDYRWTPTTGLSDSIIANPIASPLITTTYTVTGKKISPNLIFNGDFEMGNTGFTSNYLFSANDIGPQGVYSITDNVIKVHPGGSPCHDHTTGNSLLMAINGAGAPNTTVWQQSVAVEANTDYMFSAWVTNWSSTQSNLANLQISINEQLLGDIFQTLGQQCEWKEFYIIWNSGSFTSADIKLVNQNLNIFGNDFGLDDIKFRQICEMVDSVTVRVIQTPNAGLPLPLTTLCNNRDSLINVFDLISGEDSNGHWSADDLSTEAFDKLTGKLNLIMLTPGTYHINYIVDGTVTCPSDTATVEIKINNSPVSNTFISICQGQNYFAGGMYQNQSGVYSDTLHTTSGCDSIIITNLTIKDQELYHKDLTIASNPMGTLPKGSKVILTIINAEPGVEYRWYKNNVLIVGSGESIEVIADIGTDVYSVEMVSPSVQYCTGEGTIDVVGIISEFKMPNAFTPNNDGVNDKFQAVIDPSIEIVKLTVVSRWGQTMYSETGNDGWDGKFNGKDAPPDTYIYSISYRLFGSVEIYTKRGEALLMR